MFTRVVVVVGLAIGALATVALATTTRSGAISQLRGPFGCVLGPRQAAVLARTRCAAAAGLGSTQHVVVSGDGRFVYASSNDTWGLVAFKRNPQSGRLRQLPGAAGCFADASQPVAGCTPSRGLVWAFWLAASADGRNVYVTGGSGNSIAVFKRDLLTGRLTQLPGEDGCLHDRTGGTARGGPSAQASGCRIVDGLRYPRTVSVSPDGRFVYAIAFDGRTIVGFARDRATGALQPAPGVCVAERAQRGCGAATTLAGATDFTITADGRFAYATAYSSNAITGFARDVKTGVLTQIAGPGGCLAEPAIATCASGRALRGAFNLALSADERQLYVTSRISGAIAVLQRDPQSGALAQPPGAQGCAAAAAADGCAPAIGLRGARGVAVSADGTSVYAGAFTDSAVTAFTRDRGTGSLVQLPGAGGCASYSQTGRATPKTRGCAPARALSHAWAVAVSRDGRYVYSGVAGDGNSGLAIFRRR